MLGHRALGCAASLALALPLALAGPAALEGASATGKPNDGSSATPVLFEWQRIALTTVFPPAPPTPIPVGTLYLGFTSLAVNDAVQTSLQRGHTSVKAAIAQAAHDVLAEYFPTATASLDASLSNTLASVESSTSRDKGVRIGRSAAADMIASRADDGRNDTSVTFDLPPGPGVWTPPPTGMLAPWLGYVTPLVPTRPVATGTPDALTSAVYAADFDEVKRIGSLTASPADRSDHDTETAKFFTTNILIAYQDALLRYLETHPLGVSTSARLLATINGSTGNAVIQTWRLKRELGFWRPNQAIIGADSDDNPATVADPAWQPLNVSLPPFAPNPPYPDYTSGHAALTSSFAQSVRNYLGDAVPLELHSSVTGTDRTYATLSSLESDAFMSRIWLGIHFRHAMDDGYSLGHRTANRVTAMLE
ncbi:MAG TPA: vanadium-dependent haloperoxidase [Nocardioides sp.]|jgi:hypothetical protein|nr:vanadium-dependent haloperoxidase [Nocardioides sp.]